MFHTLSLYSRAATFFLCLAICGFATSVSAQNKKVIFLKNKNASPFSLDNPETYLSIRAIERRKRFNIPVDSSDFPVNPSYTSQISSLENVRVIGKSKWMNAVIIASCLLPFFTRKFILHDYLGKVGWVKNQVCYL